MTQELTVAPCLYNELLSRLDRIRQEFRCLDQGYRLSLYQLMADAMSIALAIEADPESKNDFLKRLEQKSDVVYAAMIFITEAKSEGARKRAWKGARALRYLVEEVSVPVDKIPEASVSVAGSRSLHGSRRRANRAGSHQPRKLKVMGQATLNLRERLEEINRMQTVANSEGAAQGSSSRSNSVLPQKS